MRFYRVCYNVSPFELTIDGNNRQCGFLKNVYVWARSDDKAMVAARKRLNIDLTGDGKLGHVDLNNARFEVEELDRSIRLWKLIRPEGFVFYQIESGINV